MKKIVIFLLLLSLCIYAMQLIIFRDPSTTAFYIFQDMAFMPFTIAIATIVVGEVLSDKEKKERLEKTQMLTSSFFTELGVELLFDLMDIAEADEEFRRSFIEMEISDQRSMEEIQQLIRRSTFQVHLSEASYTKLHGMITERQTMLLVISSNPLLLEHEDFTEMLWSIFHLTDEFRIRGEYGGISEADVAHIEMDLSKTLKLLLISWAANVLYTKKHYPNFYNAAMNKVVAGRMCLGKGRTEVSDPTEADIRRSLVSNRIGEVE